jgi:flagellar hook-length control protein FliK
MQTPAKGKGLFAQAVADNSTSGVSSTAQSGETQSVESTAQPADVSTPAVLLALLQAAQTPAQAVVAQPETTGSESVQTDLGSKDAETAAPSNLFSFSTSNAAYQAALTNFQASVPATQQPAWNVPASASQPTSENNNPVPPPASSPQVNAPAVSTAYTANPVAAATSVDPAAANTSSVASTAAPASQAKVAANSTHAAPFTSGQQADVNPAPTAKSFQAEPTEPANLIKNLRSDTGQHEAAKPVFEGLATAAKTKPEPAALELQQAVASVNVFTNHASSPALSRQVSVTSSQSLTTGQDSGSPPVSATEGSESGWTDDSTGDSGGDDASTQTSSTPQGSNGSKSSGSTVEFLPSSAFNNDAVGGVAPTAVHAIAAGTLQSNTGFENASFTTPVNVPQSFSAAAQEKAFAAWQSVSAQVGRVVNTATLNALQNGTEMRVQLRTDAFGSMDIRATLEGGKVGAAIGVESAEAHNALLSQLPALQQSLNERQVQLDQISVVSSHGQSETGFGTGSGKQDSDPTPSSRSPQQSWGSEQVSEPVSAPVTEAWEPATSRGRLSVQA